MSEPDGTDLRRAATMIDLGRYADAVRLLSAVLASTPDSPRGWCLLSRAQLGSGQPAEAVSAAARASALSPADDWPYRLASTALMGLGRPAEAVSAALQARTLAPQFWRSHVCLAQAATAAGRHDLAEIAAAAALAIAPGVADVHVTAGKVALGRGDVGRARQCQEAALAIDPAHSGAMNELGRISLRSHDPVAAVAHFARAARTSPGTGVFGRNSELALRWVALRVGACALLVTACLTGLAVAASAADLPVSIMLAVPLVLLGARLACLLRRLPPEGRRLLLRLPWKKTSQPRNA